jgi:hypothetical protein
VPLAVNRGTPAVIADPGAEFSKAIRAMSKTLLAPAKQEKKRRFLPTLARA